MPLTALRSFAKRSVGWPLDVLTSKELLETGSMALDVSFGCIFAYFPRFPAVLVSFEVQRKAKRCH